MVNLWCKIKKIENKKRHTLQSLFAGFVFFVFLYILTNIFSCSLCPVKKFLGISCFGCGMTRGFIAVLKLDFVSATKYNILSIPVFFSIILYFIFAVADVIFDKNYIEIIEKQLSKNYMFVLYFVILVTAYFLNNM